MIYIMNLHMYIWESVSTVIAYGRGLEVALNLNIEDLYR